MKILGVDPGSQCMGWGVVENKPLRYIDAGSIKPKAKLSFEERLCFIHLALKDIILQHEPTDIVIEDVFRGSVRNDATAMKMGKSVGICLAATAYGKAKVHMRLTTQIRYMLLGKGRGLAPKEEVRQFIQKALKIPNLIPSLDTSDALAAAYSLVVHPH